MKILTMQRCPQHTMWIIWRQRQRNSVIWCNNARYPIRRHQLGTSSHRTTQSCSLLHLIIIIFLINIIRCNANYLPVVAFVGTPGDEQEQETVRPYVVDSEGRSATVKRPTVADSSLNRPPGVPPNDRVRQLLFSWSYLRH